MAEPAKGKWPGNVKAEYITPEERDQRLAQAPPGGGVSTAQAPGTIATHHLTPPASTEEQHAQETSDQLVGRAAIVCARKLGVGYVWSTQSKKQITLDSAEVLCRKNPGLIYFDFDELATLAAKAEQELAEAEQDEESGEQEYLESEAEAEADEDPYMAEQPSTAQLDKANQVQQARQEAIQETANDYDEMSAEDRRVGDIARRAWGGTLSAPGIQVYMHPNGIARVDVEGPVRLQKGISGNVRSLRIQRVQSAPIGGQVRNTTRTTVTGSQARSPNPVAQYRQIEAPKIPVPTPPEPDYEDDDTEY